MGTFAAVILAAGLSSRMGAFKPMLPLGDVSALGFIVQRLKAAGVSDIVVVTGHRAETIVEEAARLDIRTVHNPDHLKGMMGSVKTGIRALASDVDGCLLLPVDVPLIRTATYARILAAANERGDALIHPEFAGEAGHPPYIGRALFDEILASNARLCDVFAGYAAAARHLPVFDRGCLWDMDLPDEYAYLRQRLATLSTPDDYECEAMLDAAGTPPAVRAHCQAVTDLACHMAQRLQAVGGAVDVNLVRAAAMLHDIAKGQPDHALAGARIVSDLGYGEVGAVIARHTDLGWTGKLDEAALVYLADKLTRGTGRTTLTERFALVARRFADDPDALRAASRRREEAEAVLAALERLGAAPLPGQPQDAGVTDTMGKPA